MPVIRHSVNDSIPNFVEYNYPEFVELIQIYYEHLLESSDAKYLLEAHRYILAEDDEDNYIEQLQNELGMVIPIHESITNKSLITHYLNVILSKRGTEAAVKAFFKLGYNEDVIINYPYKQLFISSITKHDTLHSCLLESSTKPDGNYYSLKGFSSGLYGDVESISYFEKDNLFYIYVEFHTNDTLKLDERIDLIGANTITCVNKGVHIPKINNPGKLFSLGDLISFTGSVVQGEFEVVQLVKDGISVNVVYGGSDYVVGDIVLSNPNNGFFAKVYTVDEYGSIKDIKVFDSGAGFVETPELRIYSKLGNDATLSAVTKAGGGINKVKIKQPALLPNTNDYKLYSANGVMADVELVRVPQTIHSNFVNNNHKTAINNFIIDSDKTHNHSYKIITNLDIKYWREYVDKYFHRSGYVYTHVNPVTVKSETQTSVKVNSSAVIHTTPSIKPLLVITQPKINSQHTSQSIVYNYVTPIPTVTQLVNSSVNATISVYNYAKPIQVSNNLINSEYVSQSIMYNYVNPIPTSITAINSQYESQSIVYNYVTPIQVSINLITGTITSTVIN